VLGALLVLAALIAATSATGVIGAATSPSSTASATSTKAGPKAPRPNVVMIVLDDFSVDLTQTLRTARWFRRNGATYANAFVVDSLCCVSRASTFTGQYPHQTGVLTNTADPLSPARPPRRLRRLPLLRQRAAFDGRVAATFGGAHGLRRQVPQSVREPQRGAAPRASPGGPISG
jgi:arylsulfatase A-like enzyme